MMKWNIGILVLGLVLFCRGLNGYAQLAGDHLLGDFGLAAGTQAPPSLVLALPLYDYYANRFIDADGNRTGGFSSNVFLLGLGANIVTNFRIFNANYGAGLLFSFVGNMTEGSGMDSQSSFAFSDTYVQPIQLGWHWERADLTVGYALYIPTGKYELGGSDNGGLGMWTNEFSVGTTIYLDKKKTLNFSMIAFYEIHSRKRNTDIRVGDILTFEGGLAKTFSIDMAKTPIPMEISLGPVYYAQFKITGDTIPAGSPDLTLDKDRIFGLGLEANILIPQTLTSISFRWLAELGARNRVEGNTFILTVGQFVLSLEKDKPGSQDK